MLAATTLLLIVVFERVKCAQQEKCAKLEISYLRKDTIDIYENDYLNLTFWLNISQCNMSDTFYTLTMKIYTVTKSLDQDERIQINNNTCTPTKSVRCVSPHGPIEICRKVNRSHDEIEWKWRWKYNQSFVEHCKAVKLNVRYLLNVTKLTVNGEEVRANEKENKTSNIVFIAGLLCGAVLLIIIAFAVTWRIRKQRCDISRSSIDNARENAGLTSVVAPARDSQESPFSHSYQGPLSLHRGTATTMELLDYPSHSEYQNSKTNCEETVSINKYEHPNGESTDPSTATEKMEMASTSDCRNTNGLIYGDLEMSSARTDVIIGSGSTTEYATIHLTAININDEDASH